MRNNLQYLMTLIHLKRDLTLSGQTGVMQAAKAKVGDGVVTGFRNTINELYRNHVQRIQSRLNTLLKCCREGRDGSWDCSTDEGKEGFDSMANLVTDIATLLDLDLNDPEGSNVDRLREDEEGVPQAQGSPHASQEQQRP